jgi:prophage regulatory protein
LRMVGKGEFPKPIKIGTRAVAWRESEIDAWITARIEDGREEALARVANGCSND